MTTQSTGSTKRRIFGVLATAIILPLIAFVPVLLVSLLIADPKSEDVGEQASTVAIHETEALETVLVTPSQFDSTHGEESVVEEDHISIDEPTFTLRIDDSTRNGIIRDSDGFTMTIDNDVTYHEILRDADMIKITVDDAVTDGDMDRFDLESGCTVTLTVMDPNEPYDAERIDSDDRYEDVFRIRGDDEEWTSLSDGCKLRFFSTRDEIGW